MSQSIWSVINPNVTSGAGLVSLLNAFKNAAVSGYSGTSRPANLQAGGFWIDTTNALLPNYYYAFMLYTGTVDMEVFRININSLSGGGKVANSEFDITRISADTTAAILNLVKQRIADNGQILDGDVVGEIQFVGRTATSTDPVVAKMVWTSSDDNETAVFGGFFSLHSTPDQSNTITEHIRFLDGLVEFKTPHKMNSLRLVGQNVATAASITQLSASKTLVEFTGSTATDLKGVNSAHDSQEVVLHNRSSAIVTLKHENVGATGNDRLKLPGGFDVQLVAESSITLYYCTTSLRWKMKSTAHSVLGKNYSQHRGYMTDWLCPSGVTQVLATPYKRRQMMSPSHATNLDVWGNAYSWGSNFVGGVGDGTQVGKSAPVAIIGGFSFAKFADGNSRLNNSPADGNFGITSNGTLYAWGSNTQGQLGLGDVAPRSSPVAVLGGRRWAFVYDIGGVWTIGTTMEGQTYAWGRTPIGTLAGAVTIVSSPVAVLGGFTFEQIAHVYPVTNGEAVAALDSTGAAYVWAGGGNATLIKGGGGSGTPAILNSSPIAVLGGFSFRKLILGNAAQNVWGMAITKDGALYSWGDNAKGQLGVGDTVARSSPVAVLAGTKFIDIATLEWSANNAVSEDFVYGLAEDGTLYAWGANLNGQLGLGDVTARSSPVAVLGGYKFKEILPIMSGGSTGGGVLAITTDGAMYGWGVQASGQLGVGDVTPRSSPVAVLGSIKWSHFAHHGNARAAGSTITAYAADGTIYSWGLNSADGGLGDLIPRSSPVAVVGGIGADVRQAQSLIAIPVVPGTTYRITCPSGRQAKFGSYDLGIDIDRVSLEYDIRGN